MGPRFGHVGAEEPQVLNSAGADEEVQQCARDHDRREHADENTEGKRQGEALDEAGGELVAKPVEDDADDQGGEVAVSDRRPGSGETGVDGADEKPNRTGGSNGATRPRFTPRYTASTASIRRVRLTP